MFSETGQFGTDIEDSSSSRTNTNRNDHFRNPRLAGMRSSNTEYFSLHRSQKNCRQNGREISAKKRKHSTSSSLPKLPLPASDENKASTSETELRSFSVGKLPPIFQAKSVLSPGAELDLKKSSNEITRAAASHYSYTDAAKRNGNANRTGVKTYLRACAKFNVPVRDKVVQGLKSGHLCLRGRSFAKREIVALCTAVLQSRTVSTLELISDGLNDREAYYISTAAMANQNLKSLVLRKNKIGIVGTNYLCQAIKANKNITLLDMSANNLNDDAMHALASLLESDANLQSLYLGGNNFSDTAAHKIGHSIGTNSTLTLLDLSWNQLRPGAGVLIFQGVQKNLKLQTLDLSYNGVGEPGALAAAKMLVNNMSLFDLNLNCNKITHAGVLEIAKALQNNTTLKRLSLSQNPLRNSSVVAVLESVAANNGSALEFIDVASMHIYPTIDPIIAKILRKRPHFQIRYQSTLNPVGSPPLTGKNPWLYYRNPLVVLREHLQKKNSRLAEVLNKMDKDGSGTVSRSEFIAAIKKCRVPLTKLQMEQLRYMLNTEGREQQVDCWGLMSVDKEVSLQKLLTADEENAPLGETNTHALNAKPSPTVINAKHSRPTVKAKPSPHINAKLSRPAVGATLSPPVINASLSGPAVNVKPSPPVINASLSGPAVNAKLNKPVFHAKLGRPVDNLCKAKLSASTVAFFDSLKQRDSHQLS